tara:strand:- start:14 stop:535 length:522 start_codon:yes stop_codon:yes gene_type:complete
VILFFLFITFLTDVHSESLSDVIFHFADFKKTYGYLPEGVFLGGSVKQADFVFSDIQFVKEKGFYRFLIEAEGNQDAELSSIPRFPAFHLNLDSKRKQMIVTFFGSSKIEVDLNSLRKRILKSPLVHDVEFYPRLEDDRWTFTLYLKKKYPIEVYELKSPSRLVIDMSTRAVH